MRKTNLYGYIYMYIIEKKNKTKNSKQILVILMLQTPMQGYYVLVCSAL